MSHVLQHLVMPNLAFGAPEEMYARLNNDKVHALMSEGRLLFETGGRASFDTFFNSVTVGAWKTHTAVQDLQLHLRGSGRFIVRLGLHRIGHAHRWLAERVVTLTLEQDIVLPIESWSNLESGMLYFALEALESGSITEGHFATRSTPQQEVKLGIVITHFNRKQWVLPAIARIRNELLKDPLYKDRIELVVVDNSQNITTEEAEGVTLIPNKNLGGSGGFTRGLLYLKDRKNFTHCLFMDDDASCEVESIKRAYNLLSQSRTPKIAIAGSMLREVEPHRLFEKGATFDGTCHPLKSGLDMRSVLDLLHAERTDKWPDYGGWWFFGFAIRDVSEFAFPFFVRGDDSRFSIANKFKLVTLNGIATWGDDFALKAGPLPIYFDTRYHLLHSSVLLNKSSPKLAVFAIKLCFGQIFSYNYTSAEAAIIAIKDFLSGPEIFVKDLDASKVRSKIAALGNQEKLVPIERAHQDIAYGDMREISFRKLARALTLNGVIVPGLFFKSTTMFQHKGFRANLREVFLHKKIHYEYEPKGVGYLAVMNRKKAIQLLFKTIFASIQIIMHHNKIKKAYKKAIPELTSENFWRNVFTTQST